MKNIVIFADLLVVRYGSVTPPLLLSKELRRRGYDVTLVSHAVSEDVKNIIEDWGVNIINLNRKYITSIPNFEAWLKALFKNKPDEISLPSESIVINASSNIVAKAHVYYAQGPMTKALDDMFAESHFHYKNIYRLIAPVLRRLEKRLVRLFRDLSMLFIGNSKFSKSMYEDWNIRVDGVIYPPLDGELFKPTTSRPSADYVLTYFGIYNKETKFSVIKKIADAGVQIKAFGHKSYHIPEWLLKHPNIEFLGYVDDKKLVDLYSNALYTLFTFTHEPFGYIPVESMACGTPVLTYNKHGPSETVIPNSTGWLVNNDEELIDLAIKLWRNGYPQKMRLESRIRGMEFDVRNITEIWVKTLRNFELL